jgi:alpha-L-fucosidase 2
MFRLDKYYPILFLLPLLAFPQEKQKTDKRLWYTRPATEWMQALPVGNGRLGAMGFGDPGHERIQLNEDSMWPGASDWEDAKGTLQDLEEITRLLRKGKTHLVDSLSIAKNRGKWHTQCPFD